MGCFNRSLAPARVEPTLRTERRDAEAPPDDSGWFSLASMGTPSVNGRFAENMATVVACVNAVSSGLAALPTRVYRSDSTGRVEAPAHPISRLIRTPNRHQTWPDWLEFTVAEMLLQGNALSAVVRDGAGRPVEIRPIPWQTVAVQLLPSGRLAYDVTTPGMPVRYLDSDVLHLKDRGDGPYVGRSRISRAPLMVNGARMLQNFADNVWQNSATPSLAVTVPSTLTPAGKRRMEAHYEQCISGASNAKKIMYLDNDTKVTPLSVSPEDAEVLESRKFSVIELCRLFNVPPPIVQDYTNNTFTNAAQASTWFATNTLAPIARKIEAEFSRSVFTDPAFHIEVDLFGLLRGDYATRWTANVAAVGAGILTADEVREQEGYGPLLAGEPEAEI